MSRAFVKEDSAVPEDPVKRQSSGRPNYVTAAGLESLKARAAELAALRAKLIAGKHEEEPRGLQLQQAEIDLAYYEGQVKSARLVDNRGLAADDVRFGARITVRDQSGCERYYSIVGEDEADAAAGKLNWASPLAAALLGKKAGALVRLERKGGELGLEIISVGYPKA
ncbi:MAG TPA: GreA/GreB family elongation factor [Elusimicrobiales bacterium]|nr:GreA/GreB family elongation factor [Elusimicrobiales bacterium]